MRVSTEKQLAAKLANKMVTEMMELTRLSASECHTILLRQFKQETPQQPIIDDQESRFIAAMFH